MPRSEAQFEKIRARSRKTILDTSLRLFSTKGFHLTSMEQIAKAANISKGLIYNYFASKNELLEAIVHHGFSQVEDLMQPPDEDLPGNEVLKIEINRIFQAVLDDPIFWQLYYSLIMQPSVFERFLEFLVEKHTEQFEYLEKIFLDLGYQNPKQEAYHFGAVIDGIFFHYLMDKENYPLTTMRDFLITKYCEEQK